MSCIGFGRSAHIVWWLPSVSGKQALDSKMNPAQVTIYSMYCTGAGPLMRSAWVVEWLLYRERSDRVDVWVCYGLSTRTVEVKLVEARPFARNHHSCSHQYLEEGQDTYELVYIVRTKKCENETLQWSCAKVCHAMLAFWFLALLSTTLVLHIQVSRLTLGPTMFTRHIAECANFRYAVTIVHVSNLCENSLRTKD